MRELKLYLITLFLVGTINFCSAKQNGPHLLSTLPADTTLIQFQEIPSRYCNQYNKKINSLEKELTNRTSRFLKHFLKDEKKLKHQLYQADSNHAKNLFLFNTDEEYKRFAEKVSSDSIFNPEKITGEYLPYTDSLNTAFNFINNKYGVSTLGNKNAEFSKYPAELQSLLAKMQSAEQLKSFVRERQQQIKSYLLRLGHVPKNITNIYTNYNKDLYYYNDEMSKLKELLNDPDKLTKEVIAILNKLPVFQAFMKKNSFLALMFPGLNENNGINNLPGLQTRNQIAQVIQAQMSGPNAQSAFSQNMSQAKSQLSALEDKVMKYGNNGSNLDIPDFKPNAEKNKSFLKRLEYGFNVQTQHSTYYFPTTSDVALSIGYKLNKDNVIGIGASYKIGFGKDINHIDLSSQGVGLRSYLDWKLKNSFFVSSGFEYNYQKIFYSVNSLSNPDDWHKSGLVGMSKIISLNSKFFKKTKMQLLWDFLSYNQVPRTATIKFRVGYNF